MAQFISAAEIDWQSCFYEASEELTRLVPVGIAAEVRCSTCNNYLSLHNNKNARQCKRSTTQSGKLEGQSLIDSYQQQTISVRSLVEELSGARGLERERDSLLEEVSELTKVMDHWRAAEVGREPLLRRFTIDW